MIGKQTQVIDNPTIVHNRFPFLFRFVLSLGSDVMQRVAQIFDTLVQFLFEFIVVTSVFRE
jgi:hypothetical protein